MKVSEVAKKFPEIADESFLKSDVDVNLPETYVNRVADCIKYWLDNSHRGLARNELNAFLGKPTVENGAVYEILSYQWFHANDISIEYQPKIKKEDSLKSTDDYIADGRLSGDVVFDIKSFSFGQPRYTELQNALNDMWKEERKQRLKEKSASSGSSQSSNSSDPYVCPESSEPLGSSVPEEDVPDYYIMVYGNSDLSSQQMGELLRKKEDIYKKLFSIEHEHSLDFIYPLPDLVLKIKAFRKYTERRGVYTTISEVDVHEWAMNNEKQVIYHGSQFCRNNPYFLMYPYDISKARHFYSADQRIFKDFGILMSRSFTCLQGNVERMSDYDGKADKDIRVCEAIRKLSGVFFLDVTKDYKYGNNNAILYINQNADNPMEGSLIDAIFRNHGVVVEEVPGSVR